jgi:hypothetical protein
VLHNVALVKLQLPIVLNVVVLELLFQIVHVHLITLLKNLIGLVVLVTTHVKNVLLIKFVQNVHCNLKDPSSLVIVMLDFMIMVMQFVQNVMTNVILVPNIQVVLLVLKEDKDLQLVNV